MSLALQQCRDLFGPAPRTFGWWRYNAYVKAYRPAWLRVARGDWLNAVYAGQERLWTGGKVVWGALVQANSLLFKPGGADSPASVVYSLDPFFEDHLAALSALAHYLFSIKGERVDEPELQAFSRLLADEMDRSPGLRVPPSLTEGRAAYHTTIMVVRKHLPKGYLKSDYFPLVVDPADRRPAMILPSKYWPSSVYKDWT